ncbi:Protein N-acetyltransferase, RimJ/RimL family [Goodfellowiella coeruleoviolacea]|uniref:Lysine N-acyltransferase MbtK n=1 Tax=Goodfellowiella coeruleoviolacea TaxID=334858 RepID=A0AAE3GJM0_9PSEU|nr:Protein N-acetyltransferase, RimJ/RimL family [Goodfellowiella coeruleoviolacea]
MRPAEPDGADLALIHGWMHQPHVVEFWHQDWPLDRWRAELARQAGGQHSLPCLAELRGQPVAYLEVYRVALDRLAGHYPHGAHDLGVHVAIGEPDRTGRGLGTALLRAVADALFAADPACQRVVAEPDTRNARSVRAFTAAGFTAAGEVRFPEKTAALLVRAREPTA